MFFSKPGFLRKQKKKTKVLLYDGE